jgi:hypothetical protein
MWPWVKTPKKYKKLNKSPDMVNWTIYVPGEYKPNLESKWPFSLVDYQEIMLENGDYLYIG